MILTLAIILIVLVIALWISVMLLWWQHEEEKPTQAIASRDVLRSVNKVVRMARRSWYSGIRYTNQAAVWGNKRARNAFVTLFPKSKAALFAKNDALTGLEHGPSSYFLANLSRPAKKARAVRKKKMVEIEPISTPDSDLSE